MSARKFVVLCLVAMVLSAPALQADYYYYGVGNNEFWRGSVDLWEALEPLPEWTAPGDAHSINRVNRIAWDGGSGDSMMGDLYWYANNLQADDVFLFSYSGHGGWNLSDSNNDDGSTSQPQSNDPTPANDAPYEYDEFFGYATDPFDINNQMFDDDFWVFDDFHQDVEVVVVGGACHAGGWVGGSGDLNDTAPATNNGLYAMMGAPEQATAIGYYAGYNDTYGDYYRPLLQEALAATVQPSITFSQWYDAAMTYGETHQHLTNVPWQEENIYRDYWPSADWVPSAHENTWYDLSGTESDHWGWENNYAQLRPTSYSTLDTEHDRPLGTPEPATTVLVVMGLMGLVARKRMKQS